MEFKSPFKKCNEITEELKSPFIYNIFNINEYYRESDILLSIIKDKEEISLQKLNNKILNYNPVIPGDILYVNGEYERFYIIDFFNISPNTYVVSSFGRIFSFLTKTERALSINNGGYLTLTLKLKNNKHKTFKVHRLVAMAFISRTEEDNKINRFHINHIDSDRTNNCYFNLEWCSHNENITYRNNLNDLYLSDEQVHQICKLLEQDASSTYILNKLGLEVNENNKKLIGGIRRGENYTYISSKYNMKQCKIKKFTDEQVHEICKLLEKKVSFGEILEILGLENNRTLRKNISSINTGEAYRYISCNYNINTDYSVDFDDNVVHTICELLEEGLSTKDILTRLKMDITDNNRERINCIRRGDTYTNISSQYNIKKFKRKPNTYYSEESIRKICELLELNKFTDKEIAVNVGLDFRKSGVRTLIRKIRAREYHVNISKDYNF